MIREDDSKMSNKSLKFKQHSRVKGRWEVTALRDVTHNTEESFNAKMYTLAMYINIYFHQFHIDLAPWDCIIKIKEGNQNIKQGQIPCGNIDQEK